MFLIALPLLTCGVSQQARCLDPSVPYIFVPLAVPGVVTYLGIVRFWYNVVMIARSSLLQLFPTYFSKACKEPTTISGKMPGRHLNKPQY